MNTRLIKIGTAALLFAATQPSHAAVFGGVEFPEGAISFADEVIGYEPAFGGGAIPTAANQGAPNSLGAPDYSGGAGCASQASCPFVSLGDGGRLVLRFVDNLLTGSNSDSDDLWIFEVGPDVEDTAVDISQDGSTWFSIGSVTGSTRGIDIDPYLLTNGFSWDAAFSYVRLTDDTNEGDQGGASVGADIDAVGAISTVFVPPGVPEPATWATMIAGFGLIGTVMRRRGRLVLPV